MCAAVELRVPGVPVLGVVHLVGEDIACVVAQVVARPEHKFEVGVGLCHSVVRQDFDCGVGGLQGVVVRLFQHCACLVQGLACSYPAVLLDHVGLCLEEFSLVCAHERPVPEVDRIVLLVCDIVYYEFSVGGKLVIV